ncbi:SDR family oxidoreductase [Flavihumibacter solisilvae]|uniref:NmrA-like domain-containing protein n=1 Tax=Flavihumibacter solisilvae TaxID=1349421 RepID=A0A0C1L5T3_9BACT|nr:SDR family oxidoreductase [Flavihumibacter solisilvae]KIC95467.1 hypothetical protein OI18_06175 [Flavihumibacter solisilvae]
MILVTGANGGLGAATINALIKKSSSLQIAGLVRDRSKAAELIEKGIDVRTGDYDDFDSLVAAFKGIEKLVLVSAPALSDLRLKRESNAILAAKEAGVKHIIFTGIQNRKDRKYIIPFITDVSDEVEKLLIESGMNYTIVENSIYADSIPLFTGETFEDNNIIFTAGNGRFAFVTRSDLGEGIATLLLQDGHENKKYTLSNSESWSFTDISAIISNISGRSISYRNISKEEYINHQVSKHNLPPFVAEFLANWGIAAQEGEFAETDNMLEQLLGRKPTGLEEFLPGLFYSTFHTT